MSQEVSKNKMSWKIMLPIMTFVLFQGGFRAFSSVVADIAKVFPDTSPTTIQMILTVPSLMSIPVSLFGAILASYITKKHLILFALFCALVGGTIPIFVHGSVSALIGSSALIGIGQGIMITLASALLAEHFEGTTRGWAMGLKQAAAATGILVLTMITGFLCTIAWYKAYYVYLLVIPIMVLVAIFLPKGKLDNKLVGKGVGLSGLKGVFTPGLIYYTILLFFLSAFNFAFFTNIGMSIMSKGLGNASAIGVATAWNQLSTIIIGIGFLIVIKLFKKFTLAAAMLITTIAFFMLYSAPSLAVIAIGGLIFGIGSGIQMPASVYFVTETVDTRSSAMAISIAMTGTSLGVTMSPVVVNAFAKMFGEINGTNGLLVGAIAFAVMLVIEVIREIFFNKDSKIGVVEKPGTENAA